MKKFYLLSITMAIFIIAAGNLNAQNKCVLKNANGTESIVTSSYETKVFQSNDHEAMIVYGDEVKPQVRGTKTTHTLNVYPPAEYYWNHLMLSDGENLLASIDSYDGDHITMELEEGSYYVVCTGRRQTEDITCVWTRDNIELSADTDVYADFDECVFSLDLDIEDENGNSFSGMNFIEGYYESFFVWLGGVQILEYIANCPFYFGEIPDLRHNSFNENSSVVNIIRMDPGNQKSYYIVTPQQNGLNQSVTFSVNADDYEVVQQRFFVNSQGEDSYYMQNDRIYDKNGGIIGSENGWHRDLIFNPELPYTIVSNARAAASSDTQSFFRKFQIRPLIHERFDHDGVGPGYNDDMVSTLSINENGEVLWEATPFFRDLEVASSFPDHFPLTPLSTAYSTDKTMYFGERTPLAVYRPVAFNANNTPMGQTRFYGQFHYTGEHSCERLTDYDSNISVYYNWQPVYTGTVAEFNESANSYQPEPCEVAVDVHNPHLFANEVPKINHTQVIFDLNKDDAMPPTMTFLRVLNEYGDESLYLDNLSQSTLVFGCADFDYHYKETEWGGYYDHMIYNGKPNVQVRCSINSVNNGDWIPLEITEDPSLFHENYGNVFIVDLSQLENRDFDEWVTVNFTLLDEAENMQSQNLTFLFYAGKMTQVQEYNNLTHSVYPNPFTDEVRITTADAVNGSANVQVYNVLGEQVYQQTVNCTDTKEFTIDGSNLKSGIYFYRINTKNGLLQGKIVKD